LAGEAPARWRRFLVRKRGSRPRAVLAPDEELKAAQRGVARLLDRLPERRALDWAVTGRGARRAAAVHCRQKWVGALDVREFFPSTSRARVALVFRALGCDPEAVELLSALTTRDGGLAQGSPCSPAIASIALAEVAPVLASEAARLGVRVTVYVDNFHASGPRRPEVEAMLDAFAREVERLGYAAHEREVRPGADALILGYRVRHSAPRSSKAARRRLRRDLRRARREGIDPKERESLKGRIGCVARHPAEARKLAAMLQGA